MPKCEKRRWKGKLVSEKVYQQRLKQSQNCKTVNENKINANSKFENQTQNSEPQNESTQSDYMEGRRIVEFSVLAEQFWCVSRKEALSLSYIEKEMHRGLGSILLVRCHKCLLINSVTTSKQHSWANRRLSRFDVNTKAVIGVLHGGLGHTHLKKILSCLNIPTIDFKTFKRYEQEVGQATESIAKESCQNAADLERQLTLENIENIQQLLPESLQSNFIIPNQSQVEEASVTFNDVVRIMVSYDMGWSRRGTGRNYDSLNGFGAIIACLDLFLITQLVIENVKNAIAEIIQLIMIVD
ncbi:uncharacterized protein [Mycetomoellerius zeteki]|uniref:uncharacterized protein n=1 Tax=Mycetomoellerius zeteki TaxID=64791 RepID=UPI00084ED013|nr:PREDICTED: uncharacterized protein LOC108729540 [Trachymyrmex zeteki]